MLLNGKEEKKSAEEEQIWEKKTCLVLTLGFPPPPPFFKRELPVSCFLPMAIPYACFVVWHAIAN